ncbi:acyltransferase family protein [Ruminiclostridium herbifermentans]|uniref:Acyltransferase family protein n=1 Tax=Ruminiclostridium herbifermentans TaxID=2488810 RepID=A0A7H1VKG8_9FIRM|nr:acyltransferase family protein [Ruminiclostridium herbifermentans]QNU65880.1 acyltransferase family protein [Ruminiclostridium herbifermentans]
MLITLAILAVYVFIAVYGIAFTKDTSHFFSKDYTTVLKGLCCIIVIFVHIPNIYGNAIQNAAGSFGYICVTLFFMFSAYGLTWSVKHKEGYLNNFFRKRVLAVLTPYIIICLLKAICGFKVFRDGTNFVFVIFMFYIIFYLSHKYINKKYRDILICAFVIFYSLAGQIANDFFGYENIILKWQTESLGFMYGIIFANIIEPFKEKVKKQYVVKIGILSAVSGILGVTYLKYKYILFAGDYILRIILGISLILLLFTITIHFRIGNIFTKYLGKISYEVFLLHGFVMSVYNVLKLQVSSGVYILMVILGTLVIAAVLNKIDTIIIQRIANPTKLFSLRQSKVSKIDT